MLDNTDRPGLEERYEVATATSDLGMDTRDGAPLKAADILAAAALSDEGGIGTSLLRLHTEWTRAAPRRFTEEMVSAHAARLPARQGRPDIKRARTELLFAHAGAVRLAAERLHGRARIMERLTEWAVLHAIDPAIVGPTLTYWLSPTCPMCDGHGKRRIEGTPVLGAICNHCHGSRMRIAPDGSGKLLQYIADCIAVGRSKTYKRLSP